MLASLLRLETLLKCDLCDSLLRTTRTLKECGHRYCEDCIYDRLGEERQCPKCHIPAIIKNLRHDPMHDTLVACVKKLKLCMMDTELTSLSLPTFNPTFNTDCTDTQEQPQQLDPEESQQPSAASPSLRTINSDPDSCIIECAFDLPDPPLIGSYNRNDHQSQYQQQSRSFDSDATTQSSQRLLTLPPRLHQISSPNDHPAVKPHTPQHPKREDSHSADDLLLAMEDEEVNHDELHEYNTANVGNPIDSSNNTRPLPLSSITKQQPSDYSNTEDLLAAMESEEVVVADDDDFLPTQHSVPSKPSLENQTPLPLSIRRRLSSETNELYQEPKTKHQKTVQILDTTVFTAQLPPTLDGNVKRLRWKCSNCLYGGNEGQHLTCGICRKERGDDVALKMNPTLTLTLPPTSNISLSTDFCVPSTVATDILQQQQQQTGVDGVIHLMSTSLSAEDNAMMDTAMTMAIDTCLKLEIYSDTRNIDDVTHLITSVNDQGLCTRTIKYLLCIITGKWIVSASWLTDSVKAGRWLPEEGYQVTGDKSSGKTHGPERGRHRRLLRLKDNQDSVGSDNGDLFYCDGSIRFFFYGNFPDNDTKVMLLQLVRKGGGKILSRRPSLDQISQVGLVVIIHSLVTFRQSKKKKSNAWLDNCIHLKDSQWLLDTAARSELVLE